MNEHPAILALFERRGITWTREQIDENPGVYRTMRACLAFDPEASDEVRDLFRSQYKVSRPIEYDRVTAKDERIENNGRNF